MREGTGLHLARHGARAGLPLLVVASLIAGSLVGCSEGEPEPAPSATASTSSSVASPGDATDRRQQLCLSATGRVNTVVEDANRELIGGTIDETAWRAAMAKAQKAADRLLEQAGSDAEVVSEYVDALRALGETPPTEFALYPWYETDALGFSSLCEAAGAPLGIVAPPGSGG